MTDLSVSPVIKSVLTWDLEELPEVECEMTHPGPGNVCTKVVRWSAPPGLCGCTPRRLACQGAYDYIVSPLRTPSLYCSACGWEAPTEEWQKGWYPV